jgi:ribonuclease E
MPDDLPDRIRENKPSAEAAERALVRRKPQIGDTMPAPPVVTDAPAVATTTGADTDAEGATTTPKKRRRRGGRGRGGSGNGGGVGGGNQTGGRQRSDQGGGGRRSGRPNRPVEAVTDDDPVELDEETLERRRGRERKGRPVGRYLMAVHVQPEATQIAVLEGRALIEHYVSRPQDDATQIHGNIYLGRVQNVLPGMEAAFVDIGTPKNAVLYRGDLQFDAEDVEQGGKARIEEILKPRQSIVCQVTKNPIGAKGARLTQEVSLPGRFVVLIPNSSTYGISKRLADEERKRLRSILDKVKPPSHGLIVRTAAEGATREELERDVRRLLTQWEQIEALAKRSNAPALLYREPDMAVRVIREEFNNSYRGVVIDDEKLFEEVRDYVASITPELADRVEYHDPAAEPLPLFEQHHVHEQLHKAVDRKVWLPSGGSLIIERTEALTVIDVNTGKNVGKSSLEETVYRNNLEAAEEVARQLRLRDIGGIIVIDFIDMEIKKNREDVIRVFREALARDKTRTQVFDISELGLVEMTRKRIGEGLIESMSQPCEPCDGRGFVFDKAMLGD